MSTGECNNGSIFSLLMSSGWISRLILSGFASRENLEHDFQPQTLWDKPKRKWIKNGVGGVMLTALIHLHEVSLIKGKF